MNMKLSRRDQIIILCATVVVVIIVGILCFLKPRYEEMQVSNDRLAAKEAEKADLEAKIATLEDLKKTLKENVKSVTELQEQFISEKEVGDTQQISQYVMDLLEPSGIEITGITLNNLSATQLNEYKYNKRALAYPLKINGDLAKELPEEVYYANSGSYPAAAPSVAVAGTVVTVSYECDLECEQLFEAIQIVADHEKNIYLQTCSAELGVSDEATPVATGSMTITVYEIYPMDPEAVDKDPSAE